jgi:hypothetical protein
MYARTRAYVVYVVIAATALAVASCSETQVGERIEVTWNGTECTVSGPAELPAGEHTFVLYDLDKQIANLAVSRLVQGKTFQDMLDKQDEPGEDFAWPSWARAAILRAAPSKEADGGEVRVFFLKNEGEYAMHLRICLIDPTSPVGTICPEHIWPCGSLQVVGAPSG